jgi:hypothetical protein
MSAKVDAAVSRVKGRSVHRAVKGSAKPHDGGRRPSRPSRWIERQIPGGCWECCGCCGCCGSIALSQEPESLRVARLFLAALASVCFAVLEVLRQPPIV